MLPSLEFLISSVSLGAALALLSMGLTLTYVTTKVSNFAHATVAITGAVVTLLLVDRVFARFYGTAGFYAVFLVSPLLAALVAGALSLSLYLFVLRPLMARGTNLIGLMIATFAFDIIINNLLVLLLQLLPPQSVGKLMGANIKGFMTFIYLPGIGNIYPTRLLLPLLAIASATLLYLFLTRTKFGIAMRASIENPQLARTLGIDVELVYKVSWFIAGALAGAAGSLVAFELDRISPDVAYLYIVSIFAGSVVGGLSSIYGALAGGFLVGFLESYLPVLLSNLYITATGGYVDLIRYQKLFSFLALIAVLLLAPQGLAGTAFASRLMRVIGRE